jgi:GAF domain-containing protein
MSSPTASVFAEIALVLQDVPSHEQTLEQVAQLAQETLACDFASITLRHSGGRLETVASTHPDVEKADAMQYEFGEGPCYEAVKEEGNFLSQNVAQDERWPRWGPEAAKLGLNSLLGLRLQTHQETFGALNLYHRQPHAYDDDDIALAGIFATHASVALAASSNDANLRRAIDTRHVIGQAQGILMERFGLDDVRAFAVLRRLSQDGNIKLRKVAQQIVAEHAGQQDPDELTTAQQ